MDKCKEDSALTIRGDVIITDSKTNEILVHKHNMIVNGGLNFIRWCIATGLSYENLSQKIKNNDKNNDFDNTTSRTFVIKVGTNANDTTRDTNAITELGNDDNVVNEISFGDSSANTISYEEDRNCFKITATISNPSLNNQYTITELGLFIRCKKDGEEDKDILFSRVTFDPIYYTAASAFTLAYYIYL